MLGLTGFVSEKESCTGTAPETSTGRPSSVPQRTGPRLCVRTLLKARERIILTG